MAAVLRNITPAAAAHLRAEHRLVAVRESLRLAEQALERNRGQITEPDWVDHVARQRGRVAEAERALVGLIVKAAA